MAHLTRSDPHKEVLRHDHLETARRHDVTGALATGGAVAGIAGAAASPSTSTTTSSGSSSSSTTPAPSTQGKTPTEPPSGTDPNGSSSTSKHPCPNMGSASTGKTARATCRRALAPATRARRLAAPTSRPASVDRPPRRSDRPSRPGRRSARAPASGGVSLPSLRRTTFRASPGCPVLSENLRPARLAIGHPSVARGRRLRNGCIVERSGQETPSTGPRRTVATRCARRIKIASRRPCCRSCRPSPSVLSQKFDGVSRQKPAPHIRRRRSRTPSTHRTAVERRRKPCIPQTLAQFLTPDASARALLPRRSPKPRRAPASSPRRRASGSWPTRCVPERARRAPRGLRS